MKHYRSYMDRITAPAGLRQRVLEAAEQGARPRRPARRLTLRLAALSACCVLAVAGGRLLWLGGSAPIPNPTAGMAATPAPAASSPAWEHTLTVGPGPFAEGEAHNFFDIPALNFPDCTDFSPRLTDRDWGVSSFEEKLTAQEIITALGGTGEVPWSLLWEGYGLDGQVFYNEKGDVLQVVMTGVRGDGRGRRRVRAGRRGRDRIGVRDRALAVGPAAIDRQRDDGVARLKSREGKVWRREVGRGGIRLCWGNCGG